MAFEPGKITKEHIEQALEIVRSKIANGEELHNSTRWDVEWEGNYYPPKEVLRHAHQLMNGEYIWERGGGSNTNTYFERFGFQIIDKNGTADYFDFKEGLESYKLSVGHMYKAEEPAASWWKQTRKQLIYLSELLSEEIDSNLIINYSERPNAQAGRGRIEFKDYVLTGCKPKQVNEDYLFIKLAIHSLSDNPKFEIEIDGNWKLDEQIYTIDSISSIKNRSSFSIPINNEFPDNWDSLVHQIKEPFAKAVKLYLEVHSKVDTIHKNKVKKMDTGNEINQILYGPPGTGKTYHTINKALQIVDPEFYNENVSDRKALTDRFKELLFEDRKEKPKDWRIAFTTFHQSFSYEDFVEGIRPKLSSEDKEEEKFGSNDEDASKSIEYILAKGIFKIICEKARCVKTEKKSVVSQMVSLSDEDFRAAEFFKISLGNSKYEEDNAIYEYCIKHNKIAIGHLDSYDLTGKSEKEIKDLSKEDPELSTGAIQLMNYFCNYLEVDDYVIVSNGNNHVRAIGIVKGEYEYNSEAEIRYPHFRSVKWLIKDKNIPVDEIYDKDFQMQPIYSLKKDWINPEFFSTKEIISSKADSESKKDNFVLIIDEINRGNISQIFGELITLIEKDKREGEEEELSVFLPYSKKRFSVPSNLYLIGTMNTADRSIEALDTALRRRFVFDEMPPKPTVIETEGALKESKGEILIGSTAFSLSEILNTINIRVNKLLDKDHLIGHSYFMNVKSFEDLQIVFKRNIIPLLEEYFYGDKGKIQLVLGKGFIKQASSSGEVDIFADSDYDESIFSDKEVWDFTEDWIINESKFESALIQLLAK